MTPSTDPDYFKKYRAKHKAKLNKRRRELYRKNRAEELARHEKASRKKGMKKREGTGEWAGKRVRVSATRRWVRYEDRIYCNSELGFTLQDVLDMAKALSEG